MTNTRSSGFGYWLLRAALVTVAAACIWLAEQRHQVWRGHLQNTFEFDNAPWIQWLALTVVAGLVIGMAVAVPLRGGYRWGNPLAFGLLPALAVAHFAFFWSSVSNESYEDFPEWLVRPRLFDEPGPNAIFMFLLGIALASGFFGSREQSASATPAASAPPEA